MEEDYGGMNLSDCEILRWWGKVILMGIAFVHNQVSKNRFKESLQEPVAV